MSTAVKTHFDRIAGRYQGNFGQRKSGKTHEFAVRMSLVASLTEGARGRLLDVACGSGEITAAALRSGSFAEAVVLDISPAMLGRAQRSLADLPVSTTITFHSIDLFGFSPAGGGKFDTILCLGLIAHTGRLPELLAHAKSMLAPDGTLVLQTSLSTHPGVKTVRAVTGSRFARREGYRLSYFALDDLRSACAGADLAITETHRYCFGFPFGDAIWRRGNYLLERIMEPLAAKIGSEAICVVNHADGRIKLRP